MTAGLANLHGWQASRRQDSRAGRLASPANQQFLQASRAIRSCRPAGNAGQLGWQVR
jgi:hypothetical protein